MLAKVRFKDGETRTYPSAKKIKIVGDFVIIKRPKRRRVAIPGREIRWVQLGKEKKVEQKDFLKEVTL
jgi:hypothetical protein